MSNAVLAVVRNIKIPCTFESTDVLDRKAMEKAAVVLKRGGISSYSDRLFVYKKSIDARKKDAIVLIYSVAVSVEEGCIKDTKAYRDIEFVSVNSPLFENTANRAKHPVVAGFGPSGMFCALALARAGLCPVVVERGADVDTRSEKVKQYWTEGKLDENTNVQFGEGGAGTFSDGKLVTRISDELCSYVLSQLVHFGAPEEITYLAKPHVGTDLLRGIVKRIREEIVSLGGKVYFCTKLEGINFDSNGKVCSVEVQNIGTVETDALFLCVGHSARDTVRMLMSRGVSVCAKPFSVGVRIEHLQSDIDNSMYGKFAGSPSLSKAQYTLSKRYDNRAVYSFCMCPGGVVTASASENDEIVTNGMSYFARDGKNANSAKAVSVNEEDFGGTVEGAMMFQKNIERRAYEIGGSAAPIQTLGDFFEDKLSCEPSRIMPTYTGRTKLCKATDVFPGFITEGLKIGFSSFENQIKGFSCKDAVLTMPETRTSSPVRIPRDSKTLQADGLSGLYPCGEGAGYAGGITSAAVDGLKSALKYITSEEI